MSQRPYLLDLLASKENQKPDYTAAEKLRPSVVLNLPDDASLRTLEEEFMARMEVRFEVRERNGNRTRGAIRDDLEQQMRSVYQHSEDHSQQPSDIVQAWENALAEALWPVRKAAQDGSDRVARPWSRRQSAQGPMQLEPAGQQLPRDLRPSKVLGLTEDNVLVEIEDKYLDALRQFLKREIDEVALDNAERALWKKLEEHLKPPENRAAERASPSRYPYQYIFPWKRAIECTSEHRSGTRSARLKAAYELQPSRVLNKEDVGEITLAENRYMEALQDYFSVGKYNEKLSLCDTLLASGVPNPEPLVEAWCARLERNANLHRNSIAASELQPSKVLGKEDSGEIVLAENKLFEAIGKRRGRDQANLSRAEESLHQVLSAHGARDPQRLIRAWREPMEDNFRISWQGRANPTSTTVSRG